MTVRGRSTLGTHPYAAGQFLRTMLENSGQMGIHTPVQNVNDCDEELPGFLNATLQDPRTANTHANLSQVLENLTLALLDDNTDAWTYDNEGTTYDWSRYLDPVANETITSEEPGGTETTWTPGNGDGDTEGPDGGDISAWGMHYFRIADEDPDLDGKTVNITCVPGAQDALRGDGYDESTLANWTFQIANFTEKANGALSLADTSPCTQQATTVDLTEADETYITATRVNATAADYEVDIEEI